jgi:hypothetical protein
MIYYDIQHFGDSSRLPWLLRLLENRNNSFRVSYDAPEVDVRRLAEDLAATDVSARRLVVDQSTPIRWCGPSQAAGLIHALRRAVTFDGWEFFINLSGTCFPLAPQERLFQYLSSALAQGHSAHFSWFQVRKPATLPEEDPDAPQQRARIGRLHLEGNAGLLEMFRDPDYFPVARVPNRLMVQCSEPPEEADLLHVSRPAPEELAFRQDYLARYPHHCGRAWFVLHRAACEDLVAFFESRQFEDSARFFLTAFEPDESFLQTLVMNGLVLSPDRVGPGSLHTFGGAPKPLTDSTIHLLDNQQRAFFGRKIQHAKAPRLRRWIEARVAGTGPASA